MAQRWLRAGRLITVENVRVREKRHVIFRSTSRNNGQGRMLGAAARTPPTTCSRPRVVTVRRGDAAWATTTPHFDHELGKLTHSFAAPCTLIAHAGGTSERRGILLLRVHGASFVRRP